MNVLGYLRLYLLTILLKIVIYLTVWWFFMMSTLMECSECFAALSMSLKGAMSYSSQNMSLYWSIGLSLWGMIQPNQQRNAPAVN